MRQIVTLWVEFILVWNGVTLLAEASQLTVGGGGGVGGGGEEGGGEGLAAGAKRRAGWGGRPRPRWACRLWHAARIMCELVLDTSDPAAEGHGMRWLPLISADKEPVNGQDTQAHKEVARAFGKGRAWGEGRLQVYKQGSRISSKYIFKTATLHAPCLLLH